MQPSHLTTHRWFGWFVLSVVLASTLTSSAQSPEKRSFWQKLNPDSLTNRPLRFIPIPVLQSGPETGLKGGMALDYFFNTEPDEPDTTRRQPKAMRAVTRDSYAFVQALYSTRRQLTLEGAWQVYSPGERYVLRGRGGYQDYSEYYWGIGNETVAEKAYDDILYRRWFLQTRAWRQIRPNVFVGLSYSFVDTRDLRAARSERLLDGIQGGRGGLVSGLGPTILFDFRNNPFSPTQGWYAEYTLQTYQPWVGSDFSYVEQLIDLRKYIPFASGSMLGFQVLGQFTEGTVPLRELPRLGGPNILRGFVLGRYRDRQLWSAQTEYRHPINRFLLAAVFAAVGGVAPTIDAFSLATTRYAGGAGMRVLLNRKKQLYARVDVAVNSNRTVNAYFRVMDAF